MKSIKQLASLIARREGKLKEVSIGNIREIVAIMCDLMVEDVSLQALMLQNGLRRAKKK